MDLLRYSLLGRPLDEILAWAASECGPDRIPRGSRADVSNGVLACARRHRSEPRVFECRPGVKVPKQLLAELLEILDELRWPTKTKYGFSRDAAGNSSNFVMGATMGVTRSSGFHKTFRHHGVNGLSKPLGLNTDIVPRSMARDRDPLLRLWRLCKAFLKAVDPAFVFSSIQVNRNFSGLPHVDKHDVTYQYALSLGDFTGGRLVVATEDPKVFLSLDTRNRMTRCDGRRAHWVTPFSGTRYSLIFYRITGRRTPMLPLTRKPSCARSTIKHSRPRRQQAARRRDSI